MHQTGLCNLPDLFDFTDEFPDQNMHGFDQEAGYLATHFSAWTKRAIGWLDPSTVPLDIGQVVHYTLHSIGLIQPPPAGRIDALQIGQQVPYLMVEARLRADQFDVNIPSEGVIVYQVQTTDPLGNAQNSMPPLNLLTKTALTVGQSFTAGNGVGVHVNSSVPGGFTVSITNPSAGVLVPNVFQLNVAKATKAVRDVGLVPRFTGLDQKGSLLVSKQSPTGRDTRRPRGQQLP